MQFAYRKSDSTFAKVLPYLVALAAVTLMAMVRDLLDPVLGDHHPFILVIFAVLVTARFGGWKPAAVSFVLGMLVALYLFVPERGTLKVIASADKAGVLVYLLVCSALIAMSEMERAAQRRAVRKADALEKEVAAHQRTHEALLRVNKLLEERASHSASPSDMCKVLPLTNDAGLSQQQGFAATS